MDITFYANFSDRHTVNKTLISVITMTGTVRDMSSITNPIIRIDVSAVEWDYNINYAHIPEYGRYYYISEITQIRNTIWDIHFAVDVLMSFQTEIKASIALLNETEFGGIERINNYMNSDSFVALNKRKTDIITFPSGFGNDPYFILITAGGIAT